VHAPEVTTAVGPARYDASMSDDTTPQDKLRAHAVARLRAKQGYWWQLAGSVVAAVVMVLIWALSGMGYFWPVWPIAFIVLALILGAIRTWGPGSSGLSETQIQNEMRKLQ
jgi:uncharacterized ion transporter superfamily protein YfcC